MKILILVAIAAAGIIFWINNIFLIFLVFIPLMGYLGLPLEFGGLGLFVNLGLHILFLWERIKIMEEKTAEKAFNKAFTVAVFFNIVFFVFVTVTLLGH